MSTTSVDPTIRRQVTASARMLLRRDPHAPISSIARRAGVSRATFYRHFGSRSALLRAVELDPPISARDRVLAAGAELVSPGGLASFTMEGLATRAGVSRATLYRLFPSKAALFTELIRRYSPFDEVIRILDELGDQPPEVVLPAMARAMALAAYPRIGLLRGMILEVASGGSDALEGVQPVIPDVIARLAGYLEAQMAAGRLRRAHPLLAIQSMLGPVVFHVLTRPVAERVLGISIGLEEAADQVADIVLRGLATCEAAA
jgi:AcrR family transcriptional regulator